MKNRACDCDNRRAGASQAGHCGNGGTAIPGPGEKRQSRNRDGSKTGFGWQDLRGGYSGLAAIGAGQGLCGHFILRDGFFTSHHGRRWGGYEGFLSAGCRYRLSKFAKSCLLQLNPGAGGQYRQYIYSFQILPCVCFGRLHYGRRRADHESGRSATHRFAKARPGLHLQRFPPPQRHPGNTVCFNRPQAQGVSDS